VQNAQEGRADSGHGEPDGLSHRGQRGRMGRVAGAFTLECHRQGKAGAGSGTEQQDGQGCQGGVDGEEQKARGVEHRGGDGEAAFRRRGAGEPGQRVDDEQTEDLEREQ
jgi:hypothetical protein